MQGGRQGSIISTEKAQIEKPRAHKEIKLHLQELQQNANEIVAALAKAKC